MVERGRCFWPQPSMTMLCYLKATWVQMGKVSCPGESEEREQRDKGMGTSPCTQLPGKLGSYTGLFLIPPQGGLQNIRYFNEEDWCNTRPHSPGSPWTPDIQLRTHQTCHGLRSHWQEVATSTGTWLRVQVPAPATGLKGQRLLPQPSWLSPFEQPHSAPQWDPKAPAQSGAPAPLHSPCRMAGVEIP